MPTNEQISVLADNMADDWQTTGWQWWRHNPVTNHWDRMSKFQAYQAVGSALTEAFPVTSPAVYLAAHVARAYDGVRAALMQNPLDLEPVD
jgi:hypothetical protein